MSKLLESCVTLSLHFSVFGVQRKLPKGLLTIGSGEAESTQAEQDQAKQRIRAGKMILDDPRIQAINSHQEKVRATIRDMYTLPCDILRAGFYPLPAALLKQCHAYLVEQGLVRAALVEQATIALPEMIENARKILEPVGAFNPLEYPSPDAFRKQFKMDVEYLTFGVPGETLQAIDPKLRQQAEEDFLKNMQEAQEEANAALRAAFAVMVTRMKESLGEDADGRKRKFHASSIDNLLNFISTFKARWVAAAGTDGDEMSKLVTEMGQLLEGTDPHQFRKVESFRTAMSAKVGEIAEQLAKLTVASGRSYSFDENDEAA